MDKNTSKFHSIPRPSLSLHNRESDMGIEPTTKPVAEDIPLATHSSNANPRETNTASAEKWKPSENKKTEQMREFFKEDNTPKVKVDQEEFEKGCVRYGLKTLKNSRWVDSAQDKKTEETSFGAKPKTLQDSRWAELQKANVI